jgi:hypothetical protein
MQVSFYISVLLSVYLISVCIVSAQPLPNEKFMKDKGLDFTGQWFIAYDVESKPSDESNEFNLKRGYVTVTKRFNDQISSRVTQDIAVDQEGDGIGDIEIRLKYGYLRYALPNTGFLHKPFIEFGLVHRPWIDFEQKINPYRVQGTMFLERYGIVRSADYGIMASTLLGGEVDESFQKKVTRYHPGKYGSIAVGIYNGGGYEEIERNANKLIEARFTIRPFPQRVTGLQFSYAGAFGKGNSEDSPDFHFHTMFISFENPHLILTGLYYQGLGSLQGDVLNETGDPVDQRGGSFFSEINMSWSPIRAFFRYDYFDSDLYPGDWTNKRIIGGLSYYFLNRSKILIDYDYMEVQESGFQIHRVFELALEFSY